MPDCEVCGKELPFPFECKHCGHVYCTEHRSPKNHQCPYYTIFQTQSKHEEETSEQTSQKQQTVEGKQHFVASENAGMPRRISELRKRPKLTKWHVLTLILVLIIGFQVILYVNLYGGYSALNSNHQDNSQSSYDALKADYDSLLSQYNTLLGQFNSLSAQYATLQSSYDALNTQSVSLQNYTSLKSAYDALDLQFSSLQTDYSSLSMQYDALQASYGSLQNSYNLLISQYDQLRYQINLRSQYYDVTKFVNGIIWVYQYKYQAVANIEILINSPHSGNHSASEPFLSYD